MGGGENVTIRLANEMARRGWKVSVAYFADNVRDEMPFVDERIRPFRIRDVDCDEFHASPGDSGKARDALVSYVKGNGIEVVVDQWWPVEYIRGVRDECGVKVVKCLHTAFYRLPTDDPDPLRKLAKAVLKPWYARRTRQAAIREVVSYLPYVDKYVFLSPRFREEFQDMAGFIDTGGLLAAIPNPATFDTCFNMDDYPGKEKTVLLVSRMEEPQKKITRALRAWRLVEADGRLAEWRFVLVGEGRDLPAYKRMAGRYGLKHVSFEGYRQPLPYYRKSRVFMMTSDFEGFPMTLVESQQNAVVPVVMDSFLSLHDIVEDGVNGLIVKNGDVAGFAAALKSLMLDGALCRRLAEKGLETCRRFGVSEVVDQWERLIGQPNR